MPTFDRRLVRPSVHDLVCALSEATRAANADGHLLDFNTDHWQQIVTDIRGEREGVRDWRKDREGRGVALVGLAWWTDALGRRHFRVWAGPHGGRGWADEDMRPALWHVSPDRVVEVIGGGRGDWLAVCDCGACGTPETLQWTGDRCGDCHQRDTESRFPPLVPLEMEEIDHLAISPDGRLLVASGDGVAQVWDLAAREVAGGWVLPHPVVSVLTFAPDGRLLVAGGDRQLRWFDVPDGREVQSVPTPRAIRHVGLSSDGNAMVLLGEKESEIWKRSDGTWVLAHSAAEHRGVSALCLSPEGDTLIVATASYLQRIRISEERVTEWSDSPFAWTPFAAPQSVWREYHGGVRYQMFAFWSEGGLSALTNSIRQGQLSLERIHLEHGNRSRLGDIDHLDRPCFSPDGQWLAGIRMTSFALEPVGPPGTGHSFDPCTGHKPTALAFSPDNETLAVADDSGTIRLWPWRRLIAA